MSNSLNKEADAAPSGLGASLRRALLAALSLAFLLEIVSRLGNRLTEWDLLFELFSTVSIVLSCTAVTLLVSRIRGNRAVRAIMYFAATALGLGVLIRIAGTFPALESLPVFGADSPSRGFILSITDLTGVTAWLFVFFGVVFQLDTTLNCLDSERDLLQREILDRQKAETILRESEGRFRAVFDNVAASILVMTPRGRLVECNLALARELGYSLDQLRDTDLELLVPKNKQEDFRGALDIFQTDTAPPQQFVVPLLRADGTVVEFNLAPTLVRPDRRQPGIVVAVLEDLSARRLRERQIEQRQRMESLAVLAGGVAHDFNNLLVGVMANAEHIARTLPADGPQAPACADIVQAAQRAADLCHQLLAYAGKAPRREQLLNLTDIIEEFRPLMKLALGPEAELRTAGATGLPLASIDPVQMGQVLLSLVSNASDALGENRGMIEVSTGEEVLAKADVALLVQPHQVAPGPHVYLEIRDNGCGLTEDELVHVFDPFYTTKRNGTGLGLPAAHGIIQAHRGGLLLRSSKGKGTAFRIYFPVAEASAPAAPSVDPPGEPEPDAQAEPSRTILIVDDEPFVRNAARRVLEHHGYDVLEACDGQEGVEVFDRRHGSIAAVLLDMTMPRMNGETAFRAMQSINPRVPVILSSGYSENDGSHADLLKDVAGYIRKPYRLQQLLEVLDKVL